MKQHFLVKMFDDDQIVGDVMHFDGCYCGYCVVGGIAVNLSCHKSEHSIRVYHKYTADRFPPELAEVAKAAERWLRKRGSYLDGCKVRYCSFGWDKDKKCMYCHKWRGEDEYLCKTCQAKPDVASQYPAPVTEVLKPSTEQQAEYDEMEASYQAMVANR